jgi:hypothetical protein
MIHRAPSSKGPNVASIRPLSAAAMTNMLVFLRVGGRRIIA